MLNFLYKTSTLYLLMTFVVLCHRSVSSDSCRAGWLSRGDFCYRLVNPGISTSDFDTAKNHCRLYGSHLVSIHSQAENDWLYDTFRFGYIGTHVVVGLHNPSTTEWVWTDGSVVDYTNWDTDEPADITCASIEFGDNRKKWQTLPCETKVAAGYMCKMPVEDITPHLTCSDTFKRSSSSQIPSSLFAVDSHSLTGSASFKMKCSVLCSRTLGCRGFNLDVGGETCVLLNININDESGAAFLKSAGTMIHYTMTTD